MMCIYIYNYFDILYLFLISYYQFLKYADVTGIFKKNDYII